MAIEPHLRLAEGGNGNPRNGGNGKPPGVLNAQRAVRQFFVANATRTQLPPELVKKLDVMKSKGTTLLNTLQPYAQASLYNFELARRFTATRSTSENLPKFLEGKLEEAAGFMGEHSVVFPSPESLKRKGYEKRNRDLETTHALSALFFVAGVARYGPDVVLESAAITVERQPLAEKLAAFFENRLQRFMDLGTKWENPRKFHEECFAAYQDFQQQLPEVFNALRIKFLMSKGQMMAYIGDDRFTTKWTAQHYLGKL